MRQGGPQHHALNLDIGLTSSTLPASSGFCRLKDSGLLHVLAGQLWNGGQNFTRKIPCDKLSGVMTAAEAAEKKAPGHCRDRGQHRLLHCGETH